MDKKYDAFNKLEELKINYEVTEHKAVFTIEEMDELGITQYGEVVKNLFLRNAKGDRHFLVVLQKDKKADLKDISSQLVCSKMSFASEERLNKYLNLTKGAVTPLGIIYDKNCSVEVVFDKDLIDNKRLGVHPNDNTATVWISFKDLIKIIEANGNKVHYINI